MKRRDFIRLLGGTTLSGFIGTPAAWAQQASPASPEFPPWGYDLGGADRTTRPGDDFFRYSNGAWLDRTVIPPDRSTMASNRPLEVAEARTREILEQASTASSFRTLRRRQVRRLLCELHGRGAGRGPRRKPDRAA